MAGKRRTSIFVDDSLLRRARRALRAPSNSEAIARALEVAVANSEVERTLDDLIRKGRGRFVEVGR
jgi:Arc/MetJ family transcription regulator